MKKIRMDLHNHLGRNGKFSCFNAVIDIAAKNLGKGGIFAIVNDKQFSVYETFINSKEGYERQNLGNAIYVPKTNILAIKGQEIIIKKGHLLILGLPEGKKIKSKNFKDILKEAREEYNAIRILDHPFYKEGIGRYLIDNPKTADELLNEVDGWEGYNASAELSFPGILPRNANKKAMDFYNLKIRGKYEIGIISVTDGHSIKVIGKSHTLLPFPDICEIRDSKILNISLKKAIKSNTNLETLVTVPNKQEALIHSGYVFKDLITGVRSKSVQ